MKIEEFKLSNQLKCILIPNSNKDLKLFSFQVAVKVGSRDENDKTRGISHLLEHMLF